MVNNVLSGLQGTRCFIYLDAIVVYGYDLQDHNDKLREVFSWLKVNNLRLQPEKCEFLLKEVAYLGDIITELEWI